MRIDVDNRIMQYLADCAYIRPEPLRIEVGYGITVNKYLTLNIKNNI